ncbi:hypothetical protein [Nocardia miyunensis]|uniref:hypothetical protein n=1 Tax=Nocardia miyunensis TaxID=282684 RepID=UPI0012F4CE2C|nr:hypothetical protein [Nocardia miyunensis]
MTDITEPIAADPPPTTGDTPVLEGALDRYAAPPLRAAGDYLTQIEYFRPIAFATSGVELGFCVRSS